MKHQIALLMLAATLGLAACSNAQPEVTEKASATAAQASMTDADAATFKSMMEAEPGTVLDVRTPGEVAEGVIAGAVHINIHDNDFAERAGKLDKSKPVYVYCKAGGRSARAAKTLMGNGFTNVINLESGITGWNAAGYETTALGK